MLCKYCVKIIIVLDKHNYINAIIIFKLNLKKYVIMQILHIIGRLDNYIIVLKIFKKKKMWKQILRLL